MTQWSSSESTRRDHRYAYLNQVYQSSKSLSEPGTRLSVYENLYIVISFSRTHTIDSFVDL